MQKRGPASIWRIVVALWFGGAVALGLLAAPAVFGTAPDRTTAADIVGAILKRWHYVALFAPLVLLIWEWTRRSLGITWRVLVLIAALLFASAQIGIDLRIVQIRANSLTAISDLPPRDPVRRHFGLLHGISMMLMLGQMVAAGALVAAGPREDDELPSKEPVANSPQP